MDLSGSHWLFLVLVFFPFLWRGCELIGKTRNSKRYVVVAFCPSSGAENGKLDNHRPVCQLIFD